jgi:hypothetical protein
VARVFGYPSWKVIVSAQRGQYLEPGSSEPGFFSVFVFNDDEFFMMRKSSFIDSGTGAPHHCAHDHECVRNRYDEKSLPLGGFGSTRAIDF